MKNNNFVIEDNVLAKYTGTEAEVIIPDGVEKIGLAAFAGCKSLVAVTIPNGVTRICVFAFEGCENLTSISIPNTVKFIDDRAFEGCTSLTSITIPDSVRRVGYRTFSGCKNLVSATIPDSTTNISKTAFEGCLLFEGEEIDINGDIVLMVLDSEEYFKLGNMDYPEHFEKSVPHKRYVFKNPNHFIDFWCGLGKKDWYWVFYTGELIYSGVADPNDIEFFEEKFFGIRAKED